MKNNTKAQAMIEYLMVMALALLILIPTVIFFTSQSQTVTVEATYAKLDSFGFNLVELSDSMYILGTDSRTTLEFNIPAGLRNITILNSTTGTYDSGNDIIFDVSMNGIDGTLLYVTTYPIFIGDCSGTMVFPSSFFENAGRRQMQLTSCGSAVALWYK